MLDGVARRAIVFVVFGVVSCGSDSGGGGATKDAGGDAGGAGQGGKGGTGGTAASGGASGSGGSGNSSGTGNATGGGGVGNATGGGGVAGAGNAPGGGGTGNLGGSGGTGGDDAVCGATGGTLGSCESSGQFDTCGNCIKGNCCSERQACLATDPKDPCAWGNVGTYISEAQCFQACFKKQTAGGASVAEAHATCSQTCVMPGCSAISPRTTALMSCLESHCLTECLD